MSACSGVVRLTAGAARFSQPSYQGICIFLGQASALGLGIYRYKLHQTGGECFWQAGVSVLIGACSAVDIGLVGGYHLASIQGVLEL